MAGSTSLEPQEGVLTNSMNTDSKEYKKFQLFLSQKATSLTGKQKLEIELTALEIKIEDYLNANENEVDIISVGDFIRFYLDKLNIKQKALAEYIGMKPSNLSKILTGSRKVNFELSFILSQLFNLDPKTWILIQVKNEYLKLKKEKKSFYEDFKLDDLIAS